MICRGVSWWLSVFTVIRVDEVTLDKARHSYELDLLRIVAAMGVVLWHYTFRGHAADDMSVLAFPRLAGVLKYVYISVYLFFMMSGFTTAMSLSEKRYADFAVSRISRLYPTFWIAVTLTALTSWLLADPRYPVTLSQYLWNLTLVAGGFGVNYVDAVYWYLLVLIRFYFILSLPLLVRQAGSIKYLTGIWMLLSILATYVDVDALRLILVPEFSPFFIAGVMFFFVRKEGMDGYKALVLVCSFLLAMRSTVTLLVLIETHYSTSFVRPLIFGGIAMLYVIMYLVAIGKMRVPYSKLLILLSSATYPLYLLHQNIGFMVFNFFGRVINKHVLLILTMVAMSLLSVGISCYAEPTIRHRLRDRLASFIAALSHAAQGFTCGWRSEPKA